MTACWCDRWWDLRDVWRGGAMMAVQALLRVRGKTKERRAVLFDAWEPIDGYFFGGWHGAYLSVDEGYVRDAFTRLGLGGDNVRFVKGNFENTIPRYAAENEGPIAVLRIDGNFVEAHVDALYGLYERVPVGGFVIFDDLLSDSRLQQMWKDFCETHGINEKVIEVTPKRTAYFRKTRAVTVDAAKRPPPYSSSP